MAREGELFVSLEPPLRRHIGAEDITNINR
jgi:hypothetical protein